MIETNHFQTIPDKPQYDPHIVNEGIEKPLDEKFLQNFLHTSKKESSQEFDFSTESEKLASQKSVTHQRKKLIYGVFGFTFLLFLLISVIGLRYLYQSDDNYSLPKIKRPSQDAVSDILKRDKSIDFITQNDSIKLLHNSLKTVNHYLQSQEYQVAQDEAKKADTLLKTYFKNDTSDTLFKLRIYHYNLFSEIYYRLNNPKKSTFYSEKALRDSLIYHGTNSLKTAKQYELMAFNLDNIGDFEQSVMLRHKAINIRLGYKDSEIDEGKLITDMNNIGEEYRTLGDFDESKKILLQAIDKVEKKHGTDAPELIILLNNLGLTYQANNEKTIALSYLQHAHKLAQTRYGNNHDLTRIVAKNITSLRGFRL